MKSPLTNPCFSRRIRDLTKTISGHPHPKALRFFYACHTAYLRLYDGSREPNTIPLGNTLRRLIAVSEARHLVKVATSKLKLSGGHYA